MIRIPVGLSNLLSSITGGTLTLTGTLTANRSLTVPDRTGLLITGPNTTLAAGSLLYGNGDAKPLELAIGANPTVLLSNGSAPSWGLITNGHIDAAAAITWTKISKTGSSLADLDTRSASDLSSGTLSDSRLSTNVPLLNAANVFTAAQSIGTFDANTPAGATGTLLHVANANNSSSIFTLDAYGAAAVPRINLRWTPGIRSAKTYPTTGGGLFQLNGWGWDEAGSAFVQQGRLICGVRENWSATARGTGWDWYGTPTGTTTSAIWLSLTDKSIIQLSGSAPTANTFPGNQLMGCNNATAATAGTVGEYLISTISSYTNFTTTATYQAMTSLSLTAGEWDVYATVTYDVNGATIAAGGNAIFAISSTSASAAGTTEGLNIMYIDQNLVAGDRHSLEFSFPLSLTATTTYYLNGQATFTLGNPRYVCTLRAVRRR